MDIRLEAEDKALIEQAAAIRGVKAATFTRNTLLQASAQIIKEAHVVTFDADAARECLNALSQPFSPNDALKKALDRGTRLGL